MSFLLPLLQWQSTNTVPLETLSLFLSSLVLCLFSSSRSTWLPLWSVKLLCLNVFHLIKIFTARKDLTHEEKTKWNDSILLPYSFHFPLHFHSWKYFSMESYTNASFVGKFCVTEYKTVIAMEIQVHNITKHTLLLQLLTPFLPIFHHVKMILVT